MVEVLKKVFSSWAAERREWVLRKRLVPGTFWADCWDLLPFGGIAKSGGEGRRGDAGAIHTESGLGERVEGMAVGWWRERETKIG